MDEDGEDSFESENDKNSDKPSKKSSPEKMAPPVTSFKRFKKRSATEEPHTEIAQAIKKLDDIAKNATEEKPYEQFGKFVASELRQLPQRQAILLQQEIQNSIIRHKLFSLPQQVPQYVDAPTYNYSSSSHPVSSDEDVLQQAMINTFGENSM